MIARVIQIATVVVLLIPNVVFAQTVKDITVKEAKQLLAKGGVNLLDVRTLDEWNTGHLKNAQRIDVMDKQFKQKVAKLDKKKPVIVYCAVGGRSSYAADDMVKLGFTKVYNMVGGIREWIKMGYPVN